MTVPDPTKEPKDQPRDVIVALTVLGEARGESETGKAAVAHVIHNRMIRHNAPPGIVCLKPWQFSCWNEGDAKKNVPPDPNRVFLLDTIAKAAANIPLGLWASCWTAAVEALEGRSADVTLGATHYCTTNLWAVDDSARAHPRWHSAQAIASGLTVETERIGHHVFARSA